MYFITTKRMLEVCFSAHPNIQYRTFFWTHGTMSRRMEVKGKTVRMSVISYKKIFRRYDIICLLQKKAALDKTNPISYYVFNR